MPEWLDRLNQFVRDTTGSITDAVGRYYNSSPLDEVVYPHVQKMTTPGSPYQLLANPEQSEYLKMRVDRIKEPDVRTRVLFEALGGYADNPKINDPLAKMNRDTLRTMLVNNGADKVSGNMRAFMQSMTGGVGGYGDTMLGFGKPRISMPTESGEDFWGSLQGNAVGSMAGSIIPMVAGNWVAGAAAAPEAALTTWQATKQILPKLASKIFKAEGTSRIPYLTKPFPKPLRNQALAWGARDASSAWNQDWETRKLMEGSNTAFADMRDDKGNITPPPELPWENNPLMYGAERAVHAAGQGLLGAAGFMLQPLATRMLGYNQVNSTIRNAAIRGAAGLASAAPQATVGAYAQNWHQTRNPNWSDISKIAALQMGSGGLIGSALPADLPHQYDARFNVARPGVSDIETRAEVPAVHDATPVSPAHLQNVQDFPDNIALATQTALLDKAAALPTQKFNEQIEAARARTRQAFVWSPEQGGFIRYTGRLDVPGSDIMKDQRLVMTAEGPKRVFNDDLLALHRVLQPTERSGIADRLLALPPGYEFLPGIEASGRPWPSHVVDENNAVIPDVLSLGTNAAGKTWVYNPATQQYMAVGTNRVQLPRRDRSLYVHLGKMEEAYRRAGEKRITNQQTPVARRTPQDWASVSDDLDANPNLKAYYEARMRAAEAAAPPVEVDPMGDIDPFATTPPIARGPARGGRLRQSNPFE